MTPKKGYWGKRCMVDSTGVLLNKANYILGDKNHQALESVCFGSFIMEFYPHLRYNKPTHSVSQP